MFNIFYNIEYTRKIFKETKIDLWSLSLHSNKGYSLNTYKNIQTNKYLNIVLTSSRNTEKYSKQYINKDLCGINYTQNNKE